MAPTAKLAEILLVEDNEGDIEMTREAFEDAHLRNNLHVAEDGETALDFLFKRGAFEDAPTPDVILLDLNLPRINGRDVLQAIKSDKALRLIPTIVLTSSESDRDVHEIYELQANCYIVKPVDAMKFMKVVQQIENFWVDIVCLPKVPSH